MSMPTCRPRRSSPPHPRGWSWVDPHLADLAAVAPAPAGMVRSAPVSEVLSTGRPRTRGDGPNSWNAASAPVKSPPHPRGWSPARGAVRQAGHVAPAPAGMVPGC